MGKRDFEDKLPLVSFITLALKIKDVTSAIALRELLHILRIESSEAPLRRPWLEFWLKTSYRKVFFDYLIETVKHELKGCRSFLELGCGSSSPVVGLIRTLYTVGVDLHLPSLRKNKGKGYFDDYILADIRHPPFSPCSFDCVASFDVIEHLTKPEGKRLIKDMETISRKKVILLTPNGFGPKHNPEDDNPLQAHRSCCTVNEFLGSGYVIFGINGIRALRGEQGWPVIRPVLIGYLISKLTDRFVYRSPHRATELLCVKSIKLKAPSKFAHTTRQEYCENRLHNILKEK